MQPQAHFDDPRVVVLAGQGSPAGRILQVHTRITVHHVVECVQELSVERHAHALVELGGLGNGEVQVPAVLPVVGAQIIGARIETEEHGPVAVVHRCRVGE